MTQVEQLIEQVAERARRFSLAPVTQDDVDAAADQAFVAEYNRLCKEHGRYFAPDMAAIAHDAEEARHAAYRAAQASGCYVSLDADSFERAPMRVERADKLGPYVAELTGRQVNLV